MFEDSAGGCFGKLPFHFIDRLQLESGITSNYWADAIALPETKASLTSIDTISLDRRDLSTSVAMAILHSANDVFAANGLPSYFSIAMCLPPESDIESLLGINRAIAQCADMIKCRIGKLHTTRADVVSTATVCVSGEVQETTAKLGKRGKVVLVGGHTGAITRNTFIENIPSEVAARTAAVRRIPGPKKDVSGDGLVGALHQLSLRHDLSISFSEKVLSRFESLDSNSETQQKNFFDYAGFVQGNCAFEHQAPLFSPSVFGPLVCLTEEVTETDPSSMMTIGMFESGSVGLRIANW